MPPVDWGLPGITIPDYIDRIVYNSTAKVATIYYHVETTNQPVTLTATSLDGMTKRLCAVNSLDQSNGIVDREATCAFQSSDSGIFVFDLKVGGKVVSSKKFKLTNKSIYAL